MSETNIQPIVVRQRRGSRAGFQQQAMQIAAEAPAYGASTTYASSAPMIITEETITGDPTWTTPDIQRLRDLRLKVRPVRDTLDEVKAMLQYRVGHVEMHKTADEHPLLFKHKYAFERAMTALREWTVLLKELIRQCSGASGARMEDHPPVPPKRGGSGGKPPVPRLVVQADGSESPMFPSLPSSPGTTEDDEDQSSTPDTISSPKKKSKNGFGDSIRRSTSEDDFKSPRQFRSSIREIKQQNALATPTALGMSQLRARILKDWKKFDNEKNELKKLTEQFFASIDCTSGKVTPRSDNLLRQFQDGVMIWNKAEEQAKQERAELENTRAHVLLHKTSQPGDGVKSSATNGAVPPPPPPPKAPIMGGGSLGATVSPVAPTWSSVQVRQRVKTTPQTQIGASISKAIAAVTGECPPAVWEKIRGRRGQAQLTAVSMPQVSVHSGTEYRLSEVCFTQETAFTMRTEVIDIIEYAPCVFRAVRDRFGITTEQFLNSIAACPLDGGELGEGRSGSLFFHSFDKRYVIKTVKATELTFFLSVLRGYYTYVTDHVDTFLARFYGLYKIKLPGRSPMTLIAMNNVLYTEGRVFKNIEIYDLKGSSFDRIVTEKEMESKHLSVRKDKNLKTKLYVGSKKAGIVKQVNDDVEFLKSLNIMDYSMLLGIHRGDEDESNGLDRARDMLGLNTRPRKTGAYTGGIRGMVGGKPTSEMYWFGIIDILQEYNTIKKMAHVYKIYILHQKDIDTIETQAYGDRFKKYFIDLISDGSPTDEERKHIRKLPPRPTVPPKMPPRVRSSDDDEISESDDDGIDGNDEEASDEPAALLAPPAPPPRQRRQSDAGLMRPPGARSAGPSVVASPVHSEGELSSEESARSHGGEPGRFKQVFSAITNAGAPKPNPKIPARAAKSSTMRM